MYGNGSSDYDKGSGMYGNGSANCDNRYLCMVKVPSTLVKVPLKITGKE